MERAYPILNGINSIEDYRAVPEAQLPALAEELRAFLIENVSKTGGHLAPSLGAVELIMALHRVFDGPDDKLVFDVGHQAYVHKILTGRRERFATLRQMDGVSGFPNRDESAYDTFNTGHATTSISAALGMARAMKHRHVDGTAVALIGDGALTGGMAFEALNDAGGKDVPLVVVVNDNDMSISANVGMLHRQLTNMRMSRSYVNIKRFIVRSLDVGPGGRWLTEHMYEFKNRIKNFLLPHQLFEEMGFTYLGPIDGHDIDKLMHVLRRAKYLRVPVIVHCVTQKGKGYAFSEKNPEKFHGVAPFCVDTGLVESAVFKSNSAVFGDALVHIAERDARVVAVTAAMPGGTGLLPFQKAFPDRFYDVGIAEEHALTMAAGMAAGGLRPVVAIYSTFLQRAFDQALHDICLMKLPVVLAVDRAGLVGEDGVTHQGVYDAAFLSLMPDMTVYSPATQQELVHMLSLAISRGEPAAIRYSRKNLMQMVSPVPVEKGKWETVQPIADCTVIATGSMVEQALPAARETGAGLINARSFKPLDTALLAAVGAQAKRVIVVEECVDCLGKSVMAALPGTPVTRLHVPDRPIRHATVTEQREECGLTTAAILQAIREET